MGREMTVLVTNGVLCLVAIITLGQLLDLYINSKGKVFSSLAVDIFK